MDDQKDDKLRRELKNLFKLGRDVRTKFFLEFCDHTPEKYLYLDGLEESDYDAEDRELKAEYDEYMQKVALVEERVAYLGKVSTAYQRFFTQGYRVVAELLPERLDEFECLYKPIKNRKDVTLKNYTIQDGLRGYRKNYKNISPNIAAICIDTQTDILKSLEDSLGTLLFDIEEVLRADLFDSELEAAQHLAKMGHLRGAGAVAGVVLEKHLKLVAHRHGFKSRKKAPSIADFNEYLKSQSVVDVIQWRRIQGLGDIRNLCDHPKDREPSLEDIEDLIHGVSRVLKQIF